MGSWYLPAVPSRCLGCSTALLLAFGIAACEDETTTDDRTVNVTGVRVDPDAFLGALGCGEGEAQSYRASLVDADTGEVVQTSEVEGCARSVVFTGVTLGAAYGAKVEIFKEPKSAASTPAWTTECGLAGSGSAVAINFEVVTVRECEPIDLGEVTPSIVVDLSGTAASACASGGDVASLELVPDADNPLPGVTLACDDLVATFDTDVEPGTTYRWSVLARDAEGALREGTTCDATASTGKKVASCGALTSWGTLSFDVPGVVGDAGAVCGEEVDGALISLDEGPLTFGPKVASCSEAASVAIPAGSYEATVRLRSGATTTHVFACAADLAPATSATLICAEK